MRTTTLKKTTAAIVIAALAGTCATVSAGGDQTQRDGASAKQHDRAMKGQMIFLRAEKVLGAGIINANDADLGTVDDLIVDRGSGRIQYIVLSEGGVLGIGSKEVAIPFASFDYDYAKDKFRLDATPEYIENAKEFVPEEWVQLESESWNDQFDEMYEQDWRRALPGRADPYAEGINQAERSTVEGTITEVRRDRTVQGVDQIVVTIDSEARGLQRVVLGPAWFVMSQDNAPMRGDSIEVRAYRLPRDGQDRFVAQTATIDGETIELRNDKGTPRWDAGGSASREKTAWSGGAAPMILLTDLIGMEAHARDQRGGEIDGAIVEMESGTVAILLLDPDENFLGIADELRCVPWQVAAVGAETVNIDADKDMLVASEKMPDDVRVFSTPARLRTVYAAYGVEMNGFEPREREAWKTGSPVSQWTGHSDIARAFRDGRSMDLNGTAQGTRTMTVPGTTVEAVGLEVRKAEGGTETVVLGPRWFMDRQSLGLEDGARVTVDAKAVTINGQRVLIATSVSTDNGRSVRLWNGDSPAWASRR